jgi:hypothetical protein
LSEALSSEMSLTVLNDSFPAHSLISIFSTIALITESLEIHFEIEIEIYLLYRNHYIDKSR